MKRLSALSIDSPSSITIKAKNPRKAVFSGAEPLTTTFKKHSDNIYKTKVDKEIIYKEANQIKFLFKKLFVKKVLEVVHEENEIWMLESGLRAKLHIWKKK